MNEQQKYSGLTTAQVKESRRQHGTNILTPPKKESLWKRFFQSLTGPLGHFFPEWEDGDMLVFILELAAILSVCISLSEYNGWLGLPVSPDGAKVFFEPAGIIMAIILASGVGFLAEVKAEREFEVLNQVNDDEPVTVIRDGHATQIPRKDVVVGDVIVITTGEEIPADATLLEATHLSIDESTLTGEPIAHKSNLAAEFTPSPSEVSDNLAAEFTPSPSEVSDNLAAEFTPSPTGEGWGGAYPAYNVYRGTKVMEGHAIAEVFAVGDNTENGKVYTASKIEDGKKTPLNEQFDRLGILITTISAIVGVLVLVGRMVIYFQTSPLTGSLGGLIAYFLQSLMIAVTLVVCAVPEGLPMAVTMALAYSMRRMLKTNNLVRKMHACETMGATTVICTDKTGTLTQNKMQVAETFLAGKDTNTENFSNSLILDTIYLDMAINSTAMLDGDTVLGNPTEGALLLWLKSQGKDYHTLRNEYEKVAEEPFSTETKYMSTTLSDGTILYKGAPEVIMQMCDTFLFDEEEALRKLQEWQSKAMRTLAFAVKFPTDSSIKNLPPQLGIVGMGLVAISDPVRTDVPPAIQECLRAGIKVKIVTGDAPETAKEIYRQVFGKEPESVVLGTASAEELAGADIIARARPMNKKLLVETLQAQGEVVAVTGDGTNDAPALKAAHVGLSMGDGTSVAKEASDITIIDNSFSSICKAVMWGRSLYINIQRFILFQLTVNITACLVVMIGSFMTPDPPLTVTQMLWVNLIMDTFAAVALASLPPSQTVMNSKPRDRKANIIDREMAIDLLGTGFVFTGLLLGLLWFFGRLNGEEKGVFFTTFILLQFWNLFCTKNFKRKRDVGLSVLSGQSDKKEFAKAFWFIATIIFLGQVFIVTIAYNFFNIAPVSADLICLVIIATGIIVGIKRVIQLTLSRVQSC